MIYYKNCGETMDQFINKINNKRNNIKNNNKRVAYCGRLDPMARGKVIILENDDCKKVIEYNKKNKIYEVKILFGISTDSDDALGIIDKIDNDIIHTADLIIDNNLFIYKNHRFMQKYHYFSTKMLNHRRKNNHDDYFHEVEIYNSRIISHLETIDYEIWKDNIIKNILSIDKNKNFRQDEIIKQWHSLDIKKINIIQLQLSVSSGFFVRQFVRDLSCLLNIPMMCYDINRVDYF